MPRYVLDTQHYIDVLRDRPAAADVLAFLRAFVAAVDFHAVVGAELLFGARAPGEPKAIRKRIINPLQAATPHHPRRCRLVCGGGRDPDAGGESRTASRA